MTALTRTFAGTGCLALAGAALLGFPAVRPAAADEGAAPAPRAVGTYDHTAFGAVIRANGNRVPASGAELVAALKKLGDVAQLPVPFSAVNSSSSLATPRVVIALRPGGRPADLGAAADGDEKDALVPGRPAKPVFNGVPNLGGFGGVRLGGTGFGAASRDVPVPPISAARATEPSVKGRLFLAANMEKTATGFRAKSIEIISWNSRNKRFDFGVIECGGPAPEVQILDGVRCFTCHRNKGPILGQGPWSNSTHNDVVRASVLKALDVPGLNGKAVPPGDPNGPPKFDANLVATEPVGGWSAGLRNNARLAELKEATTFDGISLVVPEPEACDAAVHQGAELARNRDVYRAMTRTADGRRALAVLFAAIAAPLPIDQSNALARRDLDLAFSSNFPAFADEFVAIHRASLNTLGDFSPSGSVGTLRTVTSNQPTGWGGGSAQRTDTIITWGGNPKIVGAYDARRAAGDPGVPSHRQPSNPRAFLRSQVAVPARPSAAVSAAALARTIGLTEGDRKFLAAALATLANEIERSKVTAAALAKEVFATPHFRDALTANDIPDREEFKDRFAAAVADVAAAHKVGRAVKLARADYASGPSVALPPGQQDREVAVVPTTACLRCHDVAGVGRPAFNPIPKLAFDPFDRAAREAWVRSNDARHREQVLGGMLKRVAADKDMPPEDAPEYEAFRTKDAAAFDALTGWLGAELKRAKGN
ncbi:hypothetical protein [Gemmata sp.]|uniref:hypothetical protein n=1 Tax=Gemmata sp. TaxID=1914242 RepID=UPI003F6F1CB8